MRETPREREQGQEKQREELGLHLKACCGGMAAWAGSNRAWAAMAWTMHDVGSKGTGDWARSVAICPPWTHYFGIFQKDSDLGA
jgi:hypothetical protein